MRSARIEGRAEKELKRGLGGGKSERGQKREERLNDQGRRKHAMANAIQTHRRKEDQGKGEGPGEKGGKNEKKELIRDEESMWANVHKHRQRREGRKGDN